MTFSFPSMSTQIATIASLLTLIGVSILLVQNYYATLVVLKIPRPRIPASFVDSSRSRRKPPDLELAEDEIDMKMNVTPLQRLDNGLDDSLGRLPLEILSTEAIPLKPPTGTLPTPIFLLSLPKSGTTSVFKYFSCSLNGRKYQIIRNHFTKAYNPKTGEDDRGVIIGECMRDNVQANRPIVEGCGRGVKVWTDVALFSKRACFDPGFHGLENIATYYPNATLLMTVRNPVSWYKSASGWFSLLFRLRDQCDFGRNVTSWVDFYTQHVLDVRKFAREHPTLTYLEVSLESDETPFILHQYSGIPPRCWAKCPPHGACEWKYRNSTTPKLPNTL